VKDEFKEKLAARVGDASICELILLSITIAVTKICTITLPIVITCYTVKKLFF